jgi:putative transposase
MPDGNFPKAQLPAGFRATIAGEPHTFVTVGNNLFIFKSETSGNITLLSNGQLWEGLTDGTIKEIVDLPPGSTLADRAGLAKVHPLGLSDERRGKWERDLAYAKAIRTAPHGSKTGDRAQAIIDATARAIGDRKPPSLRKIQNDLRVLRLAGDDERFLISKWSGNRESALRLPEPEVDLMLQALKRHYLILNGSTLTFAHERFLDDLREYWDERPSLVRSKFPALSTFKRILDRHYDEYEVKALREGEKAAERQFRIKMPRQRAERPLQVTYTDTTSYPGAIRDAYGVHRSLTLTFVLDDYSRAVVGFRLGFEAESWAAYSQALRNAILPKSYLADLYPDIAGRWPIAGRMETIVSDSTSALINASFQNGCAFLGINHETTKKDAPEDKGPVERSFGSVCRQFAAHLPGGGEFKEGDWKLRYPIQEASLSLEDLRADITRWIVEVYHHTPHRGLGGKTPMQKWIEGTNKHPVRHIECETDLAIFLAHKKTAKLQHYGIHFAGIVYRSRELSLLRNGTDASVEVEFVYDDQNIDKIYVLDKENGGVIAAVADDADEYTRGLSLAQHRRIRNALRKDDKIGNPSPMQLAAKKREIFGKYDSQLPKGKDVRRGMRDTLAQDRRTPYGSRPDGTPFFAPQAGFDDLIDRGRPADVNSTTTTAEEPGENADQASGDGSSPSGSDSGLRDTSPDGPNPPEKTDTMSAHNLSSEEPADDDVDDLDRFLNDNGWEGPSGS